MNAPAIDKARALLAALAGTHEQRTPPDADQRTAAWWWGNGDEACGYAINMAHLIARDRIARDLYLAHVAEARFDWPALKDWAYGVAAEIATDRHGRMRQRRKVEGYDPHWGRQAARDGLAAFLFADLADEIPGRDRRCETFQVGHQAWVRIRDGVRDRAKAVCDDFRDDLRNALQERWTLDMRDRLDRVGSMCR
jgi:hypothetical protein